MNEMVLFDENFGEEPKNYDFYRLLEEMREVHTIKRMVDARVAVYCGIRLLAIKEREHVRLYEAYEKIGIEARTATNYMMIARTFKDNPECLENIGIRKALIMASQEDGDVVRFKEDGIWVTPDGGILTHSQVVEMTSKEFEKKYREQSKELKELRDKDRNRVAEMSAMEKENKRQADLNEQLMRDANKTMLAQMKKKDQLLQEKDEENNRLRELTLEQQEAKKTGEEAFAAMDEFRGVAISAISLMNTVKLVKDAQLRAAYYGNITWARELLKSIEERAYAYFGPNIELNEEDIPPEENENHD